MSRDERLPGGNAGSGSDDSERDAWLREALRHAPDANSGAPPSVRDAILRQARQATATPGSHAETTRRASPWSASWSWLLQPPVAAGFASVMVATLVGVMWWGRPIDEPLREAAQPDVAAPVASPTPSVASPAPAAIAVAEAPPGEAAPAAARDAVAAARPPVQAPRTSSTQPRSEPSTRLERARSENTAAAEDARSEERLTGAPGMAAQQAARSDSNEVRARAVAPAPATPAMPAPPAAAPAAAPAPALAKASPPPERKREAETLADSPRPPMDAADATATARAGATPAAPAVAAARSQAATRSAAVGAADRDPSAVAAPSLAVAPTLANPLVRLRSAVAAQPEAWTWQRGNGPQEPMTDALQGWLARLDDATRARWQTLPDASAGGGAQVLRLLRDGRLHSTVRIDATGVQIDPAAETAAPVARRAPLPAAAAAALAAALERAAP